MDNVFGLYDSVRIKKTGEIGVVVAKDDDLGTKPIIYFVEKCDEYKTGSDDLLWFDADEIERT